MSEAGAKVPPEIARQHEGFSAEERAAMKDHAQELKTAARRASQTEKAAEAPRDVLAKITEMPQGDRVPAERVHEVVTAAAPALAPRLWYGMPAYALEGRVVCFFQSAEKFKSRYATPGFSDEAQLDEGPMWPVVLRADGGDGRGGGADRRAGEARGRPRRRSGRAAEQGDQASKRISGQRGEGASSRGAGTARRWRPK